MNDKRYFDVGIDIGSTTTKLAVFDHAERRIVYTEYNRHFAAQLDSVIKALERLGEKFPNAQIRTALTGSGAKPLADVLSVPFVQEVTSNALALSNDNSRVGTVIELGGQDAKIVFFDNESDGSMSVSDMRMNGSCAGGTGAFIDEIASVLKVPVEEFNELAQKGSRSYDISGRCGVYAKTDIQPLLNQGISREDLALSAFHAIAKQTVGGLAQGIDIISPVAFTGGPLCFNPVLVRVFKDMLKLKDEDVIIPENPQLTVATGAALSLERMFGDTSAISLDDLYEKLVSLKKNKKLVLSKSEPAFFTSEAEKDEFLTRHKIQEDPGQGETVKAPFIRTYIGIDSGSTTTKLVLMDENGTVFDSYYSSNFGDPFNTAKKGLIMLRDKYRKEGIRLDIQAVCTTGYGELLLNKAFGAEFHIVETVAHSRAAMEYEKDVSFILDIGGQDMKAIWMHEGIITNIVVNEACSSGCGSFLENYARTMNIPAEKIAERAFASKHPASLGSRCTVFMNSMIITEQRNGRTADDIMAGLCRSIIENVFTKVIRISNLSSLGDKIVVQGGTFCNDAILRAMEQYLGKNVIRSPYPGLMGAIGAAYIARERIGKEEVKPSFIGLDALDELTYIQDTANLCPFCTNHCKRTVMHFSNGTKWVTGNRCERGMIIGDPKDPEVRSRLKPVSGAGETPDMFDIREKLLTGEYPYLKLLPENGTVIGIPRVLSFWETMPFWTTFWKSLGYKVIISPLSTRDMYEGGLYAVTSDTVCFPAKLVHGHIRSLAAMKPDRIFMPIITTVESENTEATSRSMCAVVKGYPIVLRNSDDPSRLFDIRFDTPLFHWYNNKDRDNQLTKYMSEEFGIPADIVKKAIAASDDAMRSFREKLINEGSAIIEKVKAESSYAIILASRPYQNDPLVNHGLPKMFTGMGIPVLTVDSVPGINSVELKNSRLDIVNNFHARMLSSAIMAAGSDYLQYVQLVSFGCGHDAYLSDEIIRLMNEISGRTPLVVKLDESDIEGPLRIRVRSFIETVNMRREQGISTSVSGLKDPYPVKITGESREGMTILVPNTSHAFCRVLAAVLGSQGLNAVPLEIGREEAIRLGKQYVHNDICFPAQMLIGEMLAALKSGKYDPDHCAAGIGKYVGDCRLTHYCALLRKALDDAGFEQVPIFTNDHDDYHKLHPGFYFSPASEFKIAYTLPMIDALEGILRKMRPYEKIAGSSDRAFDEAMDELINAITGSGRTFGMREISEAFKRAIDIMCRVEYDRSTLRPTVLIIGEYVLNFHPGANHDIEDYLEKNGFEVIEAHMTDVIRKSYYYIDRQIQEYKLDKPPKEKLQYYVLDNLFNFVHANTDRIARRHPLYERAARIQDIVKASDEIVHHTFDAGEGVLIPAEILHHAEHGCRNFVILQPFG
ncbi:MAG: acyl-CoA dehydratase activase, partial [Lachnospiraceae bacterium]|nr:acyl-CoA dehydratase activase [Lachnospiraceae bacterium]